MTAATAVPERVLVTPAEMKRARIIGFVYIFMGLLVLWLFAIGTEGTARFGLTQPTDRFAGFPDLVLPAAPFAYAVAVLLAFLGGVQLMRGFGKWTNAVLGVALLLFVHGWNTDASPREEQDGKGGARYLWRYFVQLIGAIWATGRIPRQLLWVIVVLIPKGGGDY